MPILLLTTAALLTAANLQKKDHRTTRKVGAGTEQKQKQQEVGQSHKAATESTATTTATATATTSINNNKNNAEPMFEKTKERWFMTRLNFKLRQSIFNDVLKDKIANCNGKNNITASTNDKQSSSSSPSPSPSPSPSSPWLCYAENISEVYDDVVGRISCNSSNNDNTNNESREEKKKMDIGNETKNYIDHRGRQYSSQTPITATVKENKETKKLPITFIQQIMGFGTVEDVNDDDDTLTFTTDYADDDDTFNNTFDGSELRSLRGLSLADTSSVDDKYDSGSDIYFDDEDTFEFEEFEEVRLNHIYPPAGAATKLSIVSYEGDDGAAVDHKDNDNGTYATTSYATAATTKGSSTTSSSSNYSSPSVNRRDDNSLRRYSEEFTTTAAAQEELDRELPSFGKSREFRSFGTNNSGSLNYSYEGDCDNSSYDTTFLRPSFIMAKEDEEYNNTKTSDYILFHQLQPASPSVSASLSAATVVTTVNTTETTTTTPIRKPNNPGHYYKQQQKQFQPPVIKTRAKKNKLPTLRNRNNGSEDHRRRFGRSSFQGVFDNNSFVNNFF